MALTLTAAHGGATYDLNSGTDMRLVAWDGLSLAGIRRLTQRTAAQRGHSDIGYVQAARVVALGWAFTGSTLNDYYTKRRLLEAALMPQVADGVVLTFTFPDGRVRAMVGHLAGDLQMESGDRTRLHQRAAAEIECGDPRLYDPTAVTTDFYPLASLAGWEIDWELPWLISPSNASGSLTIDYASGDYTAAPEYPVLTIYGPISNPIITNTTTGQSIDLTGLTIATGETVVIDLKNGIYGDEAPTIRTGAGVSVEQFLSTDSAINEWHLAPAGEPLSAGGYGTGDNVIALAGTGGTASTRLRVVHYNRYLAI